MPTLTISFDTGNVPLSRINDAIASANGYSPTLPDGSPNPQTKAQFSKQCIRQYIVNTVRDQERAAARQNAETGVTEISLS